MKNLDAIAALIDGAIRVLYNAEKKDFDKIFGAENGPYLWDKFVNHYSAEEGSFICYLDHSNQRKLAEAAQEYALKSDSRSKDLTSLEFENLQLKKEIHHLKEPDGRPYKP